MLAATTLKVFAEIIFDIVFVFFRFIHFSEKMQHFAEKFAIYGQKCSHFFAKLYVPWNLHSGNIFTE